MHTNMPTAPITYLDDKGKKVSVDDSDTIEKPLNLTLKELALLQTCLYRSYLNCNCNLNKEVLAEILVKAKFNLRTY